MKNLIDMICNIEDFLFTSLFPNINIYDMIYYRYFNGKQNFVYYLNFPIGEKFELDNKQFECLFELQDKYNVDIHTSARCNNFVIYIIVPIA